MLRQSQTASLGVGGSWVEASHVEFCEGQAIVDDAGAADRVGVVGGVVALYWVPRRVKSALVVTLRGVSDKIAMIPSLDGFSSACAPPHTR